MYVVKLRIVLILCNLIDQLLDCPNVIKDFIHIGQLWHRTHLDKSNIQYFIHDYDVICGILQNVLCTPLL